MHTLRLSLALLLCLVCSAAVWADERPIIAIIIDDIGERLVEGRRSVALPGAITYAVLPHTPFARRLAEKAHRNGKEIMLHQPMQPLNGENMGPGGIHIDMDRAQVRKVIKDNLAAVPYARGVNNHMGSLLTRHPGHMAWVMEVLRERGDLYFVDSTTTPATVARRVAQEHGLPNARRHVFLDHEQSREFVLRQFAQLLEQAHTVGAALAIGHPYPETLDVLEALLPYLDEFGVRLLPVSEWIAQTQEQRQKQWQASLSPLAQGCEELEAVTIIDLLVRAGVQVTTAGLQAGPVKASRGVTLLPDTDLDQALRHHYDMVVLPGGMPGAQHLEDDPRIRQLLQQMHQAGKYTAAICAAPKVLAAVGLLDGRQLTSYPGFLDRSTPPGAQYKTDAVVQDGSVITSRGPGTAMDFALHLIELLCGRDTRDEVEAGLQRP